MALVIDFLCRHHVCEDFDCGHPLLNETLRLAIADPADPASVLYLVAHDDDVVRAFVSLVELTLTLDDDEHRKSRCIMLGELGSDRRHASPAVVRDLLLRTRNLIYERRQRGRNYAAIIANSLYTRSIEPRLRRMGFRQASPDSLIWYLRLRDA